MIVIAIDSMCCGPGFFRILFSFLCIYHFYLFIFNESVTTVYHRPIIFRLHYSRAPYNYFVSTFLQLAGKWT